MKRNLYNICFVNIQKEEEVNVDSNNEVISMEPKNDEAENSSNGTNTNYEGTEKV